MIPFRSMVALAISAAFLIFGGCKGSDDSNNHNNHPNQNHHMHRDQ